MNQILMWILAISALLGGMDRILGNRFGLGERFEEGFSLLGPTALSMTGILLLVPLLTRGLQVTVVPLCHFIGLDPSVSAGILAIDMGGYPLAKVLASSEEMGRYSGLVIAATFGCTVTFTIPVGMGLLSRKDRSFFARGILIGIGTLPVTFLVGGLLAHLSLLTVFLQSLPLFILSLFLMLGLLRWPEKTVHGFTVFSRGIGILTTVGLVAGAFSYLSGFSLIPGLASIEDAMAVVSSIGIVLLGSLPFAELLQRLLRHPLTFLAEKTGMNEASAAGLLLGMVSPVLCMTMMEKMDPVGKTVNAAFLVSATSAIAAHIGYTFGVDSGFVVPLLISKLSGGIAAVLTALLITRKQSGNFQNATLEKL